MQPDNRVEAILDHLRGLETERVREYLDGLRGREPNLYDAVVDLLDPPTSAPQCEPTDDVVPHALLTVTGGPHAGSTFRCDGGETFTFGRSRRARFSLPNDSAMSSLHFMLTPQRDFCLLTDLASTHGTRVNGESIEMAELSDGDEIRAGNTTFRVLAAGSVKPHPPMPEELSTIHLFVPGYELMEQIGQGGMGIVYKARNTTTGELVAVKTIRPDRAPAEEDIRRFRREMRVLHKLSHPHIVRSHDVTESQGRLFLVMEYVPGGSLKDELKKGGPLSMSRAVTLVCQVLEGLSSAHAEGVVHRDIKPGNILLAPASGRDADTTAKLADFGLARAYQASGLARLTKTGQQMGTPMYMPREQVLDFRMVTPAGDQYSAAATLYQLLTGQLPYAGVSSTADVFLRLLEEQPAVPLDQWRPDLPLGLTAAVHRALRHRPEERFASVTEFREVLLPFGVD